MHVIQNAFCDIYALYILLCESKTRIAEYFKSTYSKNNLMTEQNVDNILAFLRLVFENFIIAICILR